MVWTFEKDLEFFLHVGAHRYLHALRSYGLGGVVHVCLAIHAPLILDSDGRARRGGRSRWKSGGEGAMVETRNLPVQHTTY